MKTKRNILYVLITLALMMLACQVSSQTPTPQNPPIQKQPTPTTETLDRPPRNWLPTTDMIPGDMYRLDTYQLNNEDLVRRYQNDSLFLEFAAEIKTWDRLAGQASYYLHNQGCYLRTGWREVYHRGDIYKTVEGAQAAYRWFYDLDYDFAPKTFKEISDLGDEAYQIAYDYDSDCDPPDTLRVYWVIFRTANGLAFSQVSAVRGTIKDVEIQDLAIKLAKLMVFNFEQEIKKK